MKALIDFGRGCLIPLRNPGLPVGQIVAYEDRANPYREYVVVSKEQFDKVVAESQEIQKRNPFGSEPHRNAYYAIRQAVLDYHGQDIGEYE